MTKNRRNVKLETKVKHNSCQVSPPIPIPTMLRCVATRVARGFLELDPSSPPTSWPLPAFASDRRPDLRQKTRAAFVKFCPPPFPRLSRSLRTSVPPNSLCQVPPHVIRYAVHQGSRSARTLIKDVVSIPACSSIEDQRRGKKAPSR